ncbi:MAG: hypothetical protein ACI89L_001060 [Phycisphaerales bacterium]|jgi:hypothetical protein
MHKHAPHALAAFAASLTLCSGTVLAAPPESKGLDRAAAEAAPHAVERAAPLQRDEPLLVQDAYSATGSPNARPGQYLYRQHNADGTTVPLQVNAVQSAAREWNELLLTGIRNDKARPTVHSRNLYHISAAMWDAWAAYDANAQQIFHQEKLTPPADPAALKAAREEAITFAAYRLLVERFTDSVGNAVTIPLCNALMVSLGEDPGNTTLVGDSPAALGNRIAETIIAMGLSDGSSEQFDYANLYYTPSNEPLVPALPGNPTITDPDRWQPLALEFFVDQSGNVIPFGSLEFLGPEWGNVTPFSLTPADLTVQQRDGFDWLTYHDPGPPPLFGSDYYRWGNEMVAVWSSHLDPATGVMVDISPATFGNSVLPLAGEYESYYNFLDGGDWGVGRTVNPATGLPYPPQVVPMGDYARILAEYWADGPASETPPGHWFTILNYVSDHPQFSKRFMGTGPVLDDLEWDVKSYLAMGGAMHDSAISAWGVKGYYDYIRPVSALRHLADLGQSSDDTLPHYDPNGMVLRPGLVELVTDASIVPGQRHEHLAGLENANLGKIAIYAWRGPDYIVDPMIDEAGVGWILAENWWPYQRPSFVTPPFAGYVSGHSTFSRAAAELMTLLTGDEFFPGGVGEFFCPQNEFLVFEEGPSQDITLQWATYRDASDQTSLSRIWGGIHPPADDLPGRLMGVDIGIEAFNYAVALFNLPCPADLNGDGIADSGDIQAFISLFLVQDIAADMNFDGIVDLGDIQAFIAAFLAGC